MEASHLEADLLVDNEIVRKVRYGPWVYTFDKETREGLWEWTGLTASERWHAERNKRNLARAI